jgi:hypothetical protein
MSAWEYDAPTIFLASVPLADAAELERQNGEVDLLSPLVEQRYSRGVYTHSERSVLAQKQESVSETIRNDARIEGYGPT